MKQEVYMDTARRKFLTELAERSVDEDATTVWQRGPYTHIRVAFNYWKDDGGVFKIEGHGFAKCRPGDVWSGDEGYKRARGRAIGDAVKQMMLYEPATETEEEIPF
jgi:hypothetical protein